MPQVENAITLKNIKKSFGNLKVLNGIDLNVKRGSIVALLGPNGAGKTTTIKILATLLSPDSGEATVQGFDVVEKADKVREAIGLTGQYAAIDEFLTGRENLHMMGRLYHLSRADTKRRSEDLLKQFDLVDAANRQAKNYSGGMSRRLDLAASLIATPPILFLDEPTTGLDPRSRLNMWAIIESLVQGGSTILLTTQQLEEADRLADRIVVIDGGKVIAEGTSDELKAKVGKERIEFSFENADSLQKAKKLLRAKSLQVDAQNNSLSVANTGGVGKVKDLLEKLERERIHVAGLSLHKPTLDDVFLELTGHEATAKEPEPAAAKTKKKGKR